MKPVECPIVAWYRFLHCDISTCKNFTEETKHHCLELDRRKTEGTKKFSDAELNLYKFRSRKISTRLVQIYRKTAVQSVKSILILHRFIEWISENYQPGLACRKAHMRKLEREFPLKIKRLGWKNWMWERILDDNVWVAFSTKMGGECLSFNVHQLLGITLSRYESLLRQFHSKQKGTRK